MMIMNPKNKVKLVKRSQTAKPAEEEGQAKVEAQAEGDTARRAETSKRTTREIASRVASWVNDFQHRRPSDPRTNFAKLFTENTEPLKSF